MRYFSDIGSQNWLVFQTTGHFHGGGISRVDLEASEVLRGKLEVSDSYEEACFGSTKRDD